MKHSLVRIAYLIIAKKYAKIKKGTVRLTQSTLVLIQNITPTSNVYKFPVLNNEVPVQNDEIRLNINDEFIAYEVGWYVSASMSDEAAIPPVKIPFWLTYAPIELSTKFLQLMNSWYGTMEVLVNKIARVTNWDLKKHNRISRTQFKPSSVAFPFATIASNDYSERGMFPMQPMLTLSGAKKNEITTTLVNAVDLSSQIDFDLPDASVVLIAADRFVLVFRGMLAQNASSFQK